MSASAEAGAMSNFAGKWVSESTEGMRTEMKTRGTGVRDRFLPQRQGLNQLKERGI